MKTEWEIKYYDGSAWQNDTLDNGWVGGTNRIPNPEAPATIVRASQDERIKLFDGSDAVLSPEERIASESITFTISQLRQSEIREITEKLNSVLAEIPQKRRKIITHETKVGSTVSLDEFQGIFRSYTKEYLPGLAVISGERHQLFRLSIIFDFLRPEL